MKENQYSSNRSLTLVFLTFTLTFKTKVLLNIVVLPRKDASII